MAIVSYLWFTFEVRELISAREAPLVSTKMINLVICIVLHPAGILLVWHVFLAYIKRDRQKERTRAMIQNEKIQFDFPQR